MKITRMLANPRNFSKMTNKKNHCIVIHYVGGVSSAEANALNLQNNQTSTSAQYFVDSISVYQTVEDVHAAWGCSAVNYKHPYARNTTAIHIEMCCRRTAAGVWYLEPKTVQNTVELTVSLMKKYNIPIADVIRHYDVTGKHCPEPFVRIPSLWVNFKEDIVALLSGQTVPSSVRPYRVRKSANDAASQLQAYNNLDSAKDLANRNPGYEVYDQTGKLIYDPLGNVQLFRYYKVKNNDSWWKVAAREMGNGQRMYELAAFNNKTIKNVISPGQVLKVPA